MQANFHKEVFLSVMQYVTFGLGVMTLSDLCSEVGLYETGFMLLISSTVVIIRTSVFENKTFVFHVLLRIFKMQCAFCELEQEQNKQTPWRESSSELYGEVSVNVLLLEDVAWSAQRISTAVFSAF
jgi:hypothetical protein